MDWLETVKDDLRKATIIHITTAKETYRYIVNPLSSGVPEIPTEALWGCAFEIARVANVKGTTKILTPEAMGIHIAAALSMVTGIPMLIIRKKRNFLPGEVEVIKRTGYAETKMYISQVGKGDRILLVDSIIATGGTYTALLRALENLGATIQDAVAVIERVEFQGVARVKQETGYDVKTLLKVMLRNGRVELV